MTDRAGLSLFIRMSLPDLSESRHRLHDSASTAVPDLNLFPAEPQGRVVCIQVSRRFLTTIQENVATLPVRYSRPVCCLDGVNAFDPYPFAQLARRTGEDIHEVLNLVRVSRAFTIHQLQEAVERLLPPLTKVEPTPLVVMLGLEHLFLEESLPLWERRHVLGRILERLMNLCRTGMPVLTTFENVENGNGRIWTQMIRECSDDLARFSVSENGATRLEWE